jgi:hypothetical protein
VLTVTSEAVVVVWQAEVKAATVASASAGIMRMRADMPNETVPVKPPGADGCRSDSKEARSKSAILKPFIL